MRGWLNRITFSGLVLTGFAGPGFAKDAGSLKIPFAFVENKGQAKPEIRYIGNGPEFKAWFRERGFSLQRGDALIEVRFAGGLAQPRMEASDELGATTNYVRGADPRGWQTNLPMFQRLVYRDVWPGIDVRFRTDDSRPKAEYIVAPGSSVSQIRLAIEGKAEIRKDGALVVRGRSGEFREDKPLLFQGEGAGRKEIDGAFRLCDDGTVGFEAGEYDPEKPLVVDPILVFSGYFGGVSQTTITGVQIDSYYDTIVAGWTAATDLPASGGARPNSGGGVDAFVAAFGPAGGNLLYCTYIGGSGDDRAFGLAVDSSNNAYVTGWTSSRDFPVSAPVQSRLSGSRDAFVAKLNASGNALVFSTYLGGSGVDVGYAIALDAANAPIIVGDTTSTNLPATAGVVQPRLAGGQDAFVAKLNAAGTAISFLTYWGGTANDHGAAIALDRSGLIYFGGNTYSANFPVSHAAQSQSGGGQDGFFAKLSGDGKAIVFSTYLGGTGGTAGAPEEINGIEVTTSACVAGTTSSVDFPITSVSRQKVFGGGVTDGFISCYGLDGSFLRSTYVGGSLDDGIKAIAIDFDGYLYITGYTTSQDFPAVINPWQSANAGQMDAFVAKLTSNRLVYGTYLGGNGNDSGNAIAVDSLTNVVVAGATGSGNFPNSGNVGTWSGSILSSFFARIAPPFTLAVAATPAFYFDVWHNTGYNGSAVTLNAASFGQSGDIPVAGDWDGSGKKRIGVFRSGLWILDINGNGVIDAADKTIQFGQAGDLPVCGDWNGTGRLKLGLFRQGTFILDLSGHLSGTPTGLSDATFAFGQAGDLPVALDWNQSGFTKIGVFRNGLWLVDYNGDHVFDNLDYTYQFGQAGDIPVTGDWSGTGIQKIGVYRNGLWLLDYDGVHNQTHGYWSAIAFGGPGYVPLSW